VTDEKPPVEKAVELFVYAPVGMALYVRDMLPSMMGIFVSRGKREVLSHRAPPPPPVTPPPIPDEMKRRIDESVGMARVVAEGGFGVARDVAGSSLGVARGMAGSALQGFLAMRNGEPAASTAGGSTGGASTAPAGTRDPEPSMPEPSAPPPAPDAKPAPEAKRVPEAKPAPVVAKEPSEPTTTTTAPTAESLPIPDYDELSASQVVERLDGLDHDSLEAVRSYEAEHRGRNTILGKIAQLS
jgi:hypothetical protein